MASWSNVGLNANINLGSRLLWGEAGWSAASAFAIFFSLRTDQAYFALAAAGLSLWAWAQSRKKYRGIADMATANLLSASQGHVGLSGIGDAMPEYPLVSPLTSLPCLWFDYKVEKGSGKNRSIIRQETSESPFAITEKDLQVMVLPEGALVISKHQQTWQRGDETYTESVLLKDENLFILGEYVHDWVESNGNSVDKQVGALLQEWKSDQTELKSRFDKDSDGNIDSDEWQTARKRAQHDVLSGKFIPQNTAKQCIRKPKSGELFIISNYAAQHLAARFQRWSWLHLFIFCVALFAVSR